MCTGHIFETIRRGAGEKELFLAIDIALCLLFTVYC